MIFKAVRERPPYPDHGVTTQREWAVIAPRQIRLADLTTTRATLDLRSLLDDDSTFYGDLFAHVVSFKGDLYLETTATSTQDLEKPRPRRGPMSHRAHHRPVSAIVHYPGSRE